MCVYWSLCVCVFVFSCVCVLCVCAQTNTQILESRHTEDPSFLSEKRVCEVGSGLGVGGICAWMYGCKDVVLTEKDSVVLELLRVNAFAAYL